MSSYKTALSINLVMNSAIKGSNFLNASVNKLHTYAKKVEKISLLKSTPFPKLNSNINKLSVGLGGLKRQTAKISANPINLGLETTNMKLKLVRKDITGIAQKSREARNYSKLWADDLQRGAKVANTKIKHTGSYISNKVKVGGAIAGAGVIGAMSTLNPIDKAIKFESAMADVVKATNANKSQALTIKAQILKTVAQGSLIDPSSLAQIYAGGGKSGIATSDLPSFAKTVGMGAIALDIEDYNSAGATFALMAEKMNLPISKVNTLMDAFTHMENKGTQSANKMISTTGRLAGTFSSLKFKPKNAVAVSSWLNSLAPDASTAATNFKILTNRLLKTNSEFGYLDRIKKGGAGAIAGVITDIKSSMTDDMILKKFGSEAFNIIQTMSTKTSLLKKNLGFMSGNQSVGAMANEYKVKIATTGARETMARNKTNVSMIGVGDELKKPYIALYEATAKAITGVTNFYKSNKELINTLAPIALGIGATAIAIKAISTVINPFIGLTNGIWKFRSQLKTGAIFAYKIALSGLSMASSFIGSAFSGAIGFIRSFSLATTLATAKQWLFNIALNANPIGLIVLGIGAVITAGVLLYKNWDYLKTKAVEIWNGITKAIKSPFVTLFSWIENKFKAVMGIISKVKGFASKVSNIGSNALNGVKNGASNAWSSTKNFFGFGSDKKEDKLKSKVLKPANNLNYTNVATTLKTSSLKEMKIPQIVPIESPSSISENFLNSQNSVLNNNSNDTQSTVTNNFNITITSTDGIIDEEALKEQFIRIQNAVRHDNMEMDMRDIA